MDKVAIILTTLERPNLFQKCLESIMANWQDNWVLMIGMQDHYDSASYYIISKIIEDNPGKEVRLYDLEYDCGISKARNELIQKAHLWNIPYVLLTADSIMFNDSVKDISRLLLVLDEGYYKLIGLPLENRISWEANLRLITGQAFELDFIEKNVNAEVCLVGDVTFNLWPCDIVRNFWIARTETLVKVPYDEQLIMCEHEDFFYRYKEAGYKVCCTNIVNGMYEKEQNPPEYNKIRTNNFRIGKQRLLDKYSLVSWVSYNNIERIGL